MVPTIFRLFQRKKFSTRTNDLRAKSFLDYFASPSGGETPDFLLFGRLLGLQPYQTSTISPGMVWYGMVWYGAMLKKGDA